MATLSETFGTADRAYRKRLGRFFEGVVITTRIFTILAGAYLTVACFDIIAASLINSLGVPMDDAMAWSVMFGFLVYVAIIIWAFAAPERHRSATVIAISGVILSIIAAAFTPAVVT